MFEIHTSMSEELIIDELCQMEKKFAPIGKVTAEKFDLLVIPPAHEGGRRRSGGFVQLTGRIVQQEDANCIQVKEHSGVGFIIPMIMVVFFSVVLAGAVLAGNWTPELLFPIGFLIMFSSL